MADIKVSAETELTAVAGNDAILIIDDMTGTPVDRRVKVANLVHGGFTSTATAAGTTTLTVASTRHQAFTGATTQTVVLPDATTLALGHRFCIENDSTGNLTINANGGGLVRTLTTLNDVQLTCTSIGTAAGTWDVSPYMKDNAPNTLTNSLTLAAGTTTLAPLILQPGTSMTTPTDGAFEMDADCLYFTHDLGNRGVIPNTQLIRADTTRTFTSNTTQQAIFTTPANGSITLETGCYMFEGLIAMSAMSATSGNGKFSIIGAGTATLGSVLWMAVGADTTAIAETTGGAAGASFHIIATQTATNIVTTGTSVELCFVVQGTFEVTVAGTIIPSFAQTTAAAAIVSVGSYIQVNRVGSTSLTSIGQWT